MTRTEFSRTTSATLGLWSSTLGHFGDANFHQSIQYNPNDEREKAAVSKVVHDIVSKALEMEGTCSVSQIKSPAAVVLICLIIGRTWHWTWKEGARNL